MPPTEPSLRGSKSGGRGCGRTPPRRPSRWRTRAERPRGRGRHAEPWDPSEHADSSEIAGHGSREESGAAPTGFLSLSSPPQGPTLPSLLPWAGVYASPMVAVHATEAPPPAPLDPRLRRARLRTRSSGEIGTP